MTIARTVAAAAWQAEPFGHRWILAQTFDVGEAPSVHQRRQTG